MNELYKKIYNEDEDYIVEPIRWLYAIYHDGVCMGEYTDCDEETAEEVYKCGLETVAFLVKKNRERGIEVSPYDFQVFIRPATIGDIEG